MKPLYQKIITVGVVGASFVLPQASFPKDSPSKNAPAPSQWSKQMQDMYKTLAELLTDVSSDQRFNDPKNFSKIKNNTKKLATLTHELTPQKADLPDPDPTIPIVAHMLSRETERAVLELDRGHRAYARRILRSVSNYCVTCHTRNASGPQIDKLPFEPAHESLSSIERGEFYVATRQFDRAQEEFRKVLENPKPADLSSWDWEKAVRESLAIAVRVKKDPDQAKKIAQLVLGAEKAPLFMKDDAQAWLVSIEEWRKEPSKHAKTETGLYAEAVRLMTKAHEVQKYPVDRTADVYYLRASSVIHQLLQTAPEGMYGAQALLMAGICYEVLNPIRTENIHDIYYETCIRKFPRTSQAELCYRRYEESIYLGYTGSAGTDIPSDVKKRLGELKALSQVSASPPQK